MKHLVSIFLITLPILAKAQVNYSEDIAPIIYDKCTTCHRPGEVGPMPFTSYEEVSAWAGMIEYVTEIEYMPPWPPEQGFNHYLNERSLSQDEIQMISDWVEAGSPQGDPALEPELPVFSSGSQIGTPDLVLEMAEPHFIQGNNRDDYRVFVIPTDFDEDKEIASLEFRPGNNRAVHHVLMAYDVTGTARQLDDATPEYGYFSFGDFGFDEAVWYSFVYVPGSQPLVLPEGIGELLPAGADLLIQVHYAPLSTDENDQSKINVFFKDESDPIERVVQTGITLPGNLPGGWNSFVIPPNEIKIFEATSVNEDLFTYFPGIDYDISLISVFPHSHLLGKSYEIFVVSPAGDTINLIKIPEWDFNWQGTYVFQNMQKIPANSTWITRAAYDNTADNPNNPSNPPRTVFWGDGTKDEMLVNFIHYVPYQEGDEDIDLGGGINTSTYTAVSPTRSTLNPVIPNPSDGSFGLQFELKQSERLHFELMSVDGRFLKTLSAKTQYDAGEHRISVNALEYGDGNYFVRMVGENYSLIGNLIIQK